jgi:hypothetical protein
MVRQSPPATQRVFQSATLVSNNRQNFKGLDLNFRSILHSRDASALQKSARSIAPTDTEIVPGTAKRPGDRPLALPAALEGGEVDPLELALAQPQNPHHPPSLATNETSGRATERGLFIETALVQEVVRRVSWGGDRRRGVARIELDGAFSGTTIWVRGEGRALELEVSFGRGLESDGLAERLLRRLRARGLDVTELEVR